MIANLGCKWLRAWMSLALLMCALPAAAQTRAWLDREQVTYGETATLNIETGSSVQQIDYAPLTRQFDIAGQTVRRSFQLVNGHSSSRSLFAVGIRPRGPGVLTVPALRVGNDITEPLRMTVSPPTVHPANSNADAFVETEVDADKPYVQQAVGMVVRLFVGVDLASGQLDQDQPPDSSLQQVGEDLHYQRQLEGRRYNVIERRYLLIPERSGTLVVPGARFNGQLASGFFDGAFGDGSTPLSASAPEKRLQVRPIPADALQPWVPLRDLQLHYLQAPTQARVGVATSLEVEMVADGASATQLPALVFPPSKDMQVFADPPQSEMQLVNGRPRTTVQQRISVVPLHAGSVDLVGPSVGWWDATQGVARTTTLPTLKLQVAQGLVSNHAGSDEVPRASTDVVAPPERASLLLMAPLMSTLKRALPWLAAGLGLIVLLGGGWWFSRRRMAPANGAVDNPLSAAEIHSQTAPSLADALKAGDLGDVAQALCKSAGLPGEDLDALRKRLDAAAQVAAVAELQLARWGGGNATAALASLRTAFGHGVRLRGQERSSEVILPPLYPER
jgi:hypothetical protein